MAFEIMVPYTMGTLDKKRIGLTSKTCAKRKETVSARVVGAGIATRAATQGAGLQLSGRRGHCRATSGGPRLEGSCGQNAGAPKAGGGGQRTRAYAGGGGAGPLVRTQKRVPGSRSAHQTIGKCMKACAQTVAHARDDRVQGRRGAGQSDLCAESVRARAGVEGVCVRMRVRAVRRSGQGGSPSPRQVTSRIQQPISSSTFCLSGELIPTEWAKHLCYRQNGVAGSPFVHDSIIICTISSLL
jgi:hypothetical protein